MHKHHGVIVVFWELSGLSMSGLLLCLSVWTCQLWKRWQTTSTEKSTQLILKKSLLACSPMFFGSIVVLHCEKASVFHCVFQSAQSQNKDYCMGG